MKKRNIAVISLVLTLILMLTTACGSKENDKDKDKDTSKKPSSSQGTSNTDDSASENETENEKNNNKKTETISYYEGSKSELLKFEKGMDVFGEKSISVIGDSISQGQNATKMYDEAWVSLFQKSLNSKNGTYNIGYVSLLGTIDYNGYVCKSIHTVTDKTGNWVRKSGWESPLTPGNCSYTAPSFTEGATLEIKLNRKADGIDRHINGFYVYHTAGATYGKYYVKVNGQNVATVDSFSKESKLMARSQYIEIPAGVGDDVTIEIVKATNSIEQVTITGMSYIDKPSAITVNNYSLSGIKLTEIDDDLLRELTKANFVLFTLGTNDAGTSVDIDEFQRKVDIVVESCKKNGSTLIVGDVIWSRYGNDYWATNYKDILKKAAEDANGYFIDFTTIGNHLVLEADKDICHPTVKGHSLMAEKLCGFFELKLK